MFPACLKKSCEKTLISLFQLLSKNIFFELEKVIRKLCEYISRRIFSAKMGVSWLEMAFGSLLWLICGKQRGVGREDRSGRAPSPFVHQ